jgi:hypothetical protein
MQLKAPTTFLPTHNDVIACAGDVLLDLPALTYLELSESSALDHLGALTGLQDLRFDLEDDTLITGAMLERLTAMTSLRVNCFGASARLEPEVLSNRSRLQHMRLACVSFTAGRDAIHVLTHPTAAALSQLQHLQALTHLDLQGALRVPEAPAAASQPSQHAATCATSTSHTTGSHQTYGSSCLCRASNCLIFGT